MKILILGGRGFVGKEIVNLLRCDNYADVFVASRNSEISINLSDFSMYKKTFDHLDFDIVICSAVSYSDTFSDSIENVNITSNVIEYFKDKSKQIIFVSSLSALSENKNISVYNLTKYMSEQVIDFYQSKGINSITTLRFSQIIDINGGSRKTQKGFHYIVDSIVNNRELNVFSLNDLPRSYIAVEYVAHCIKHAIDKKITGFHNIVLNPLFNLKELVLFLAKASNYSNKITYLEKEALHYYIPEPSDTYIDFLNKYDMQKYIGEFIK